jgi:hypothetical protein
MQLKCTASTQELADLYRSGLTLQEIGNRYGVTRERIRQRLKGSGVDRFIGGHSKYSFDKRKEKLAAIDKQCFKKHGCTLALLKSLRKMGSKPTYAYQQQRRNANDRSIKWNIKLYEWWMVWLGSGKWEQRGRFKGQYVMARLKDSGPYEIGNVYISKCEENVQDGYYFRSQS